MHGPDEKTDGGKIRKKIVRKLKKMEHDYDAKPHLSFVDSLKLIRDESEKKKTMRVAEIFDILAGRGYPALLILFSLPFCFPIQIPGFSTPFGLVLMIIGTRMAFGKIPWWPEWLLVKELSSAIVSKIVDKTLSFFLKVQKVVKPRLSFFLWEPFKHFHGFMIIIYGALLSLPLVLPFTNFFAALPILLFGIGLLEDDGLIILFAYLVGFASLAFFLGLLWFGKQLLLALI